MGYKLNELCEYIARGITPKYSDDSSFCVLNQKCIRDNAVSFINSRRHDNNAKIVSKDKTIRLCDILINSTGVGTAGRIAQIKTIPTDYSAMTVDSHVTIVRPNPERVFPEFLGYYLQYKQPYIESLAKGSTGQTEISRDSIANVEVEIPDLETQKKIVRILSVLDEKIELNTKLISSLYSLGDAAYKTICDGNSKIVTLKEISINYDKKRVPLSSRQREARRGKFPYYGATSILDYVDDYLFDGEYVLLGEDGTVITNEGSAVLQYIWGKNWVNNHAHVLQGSEVSTEYLLFALRSVNVTALVTGAVQPKINQENMNKIKLSIGSGDEMTKVEKVIKTIAAQIRNLTDETRVLSKMRDTLLPKLMSGEININEAALQ